MENHWPSRLRGPNTESTLLGHVVGFGRRLRAAGIAVDPASMIDLCKALDHIEIGVRADLRAAARATLLSNRDDLENFEKLFAEYWDRKPETELASGPSPDYRELDDSQPRQQSASESLQQQKLLLVDEAQTDSTQPVDGEAIAYSKQDVLRHKDFGQMNEDEIASARTLIARFVRILANRPGHRFRPARRGRSVDFRKSFRQNLSHGFAALELKYKKRRVKKLKVIVLCDVSGSMAQYSSFLLEFVFAIRERLPTTEAAIFATHMSSISDSLHAGTIANALRNVSRVAGGWGGGTDIGGSLAEFNDHYARSMLRSKAIVVILSDGWDRGDAARMQREVTRLRRRAHKLIWLNPLLGGSDYQPLCRGMQTALPHVDHFLPAHNLASLANVVDVLRKT